MLIAHVDADPTSPDEARARFREGLRVPTSGWLPGYVQANLIAVPREYAYDVLLFAHRNPKPCPILDVSDAGSPHTVLAPGADLRTDLPAYRVFRDGELTDEVSDVSAFWRDDLVTFLIGCSFSFDGPLAEAGIIPRHVEQSCNVPMYLTNRQCRPAGRMRGPLVVSMRPVPAAQVSRAVEVTARYPDTHGAPVHVGDPAALGIADISRPDFGDPVRIDEGELPVFWACGVTPQAAVMESRPPFAISHSPGHMFITDRRDSQYQR